MSSNLDKYITHSSPPPSALFYSQSIHDRGSIFQAALYALPSSSSSSSSTTALHIRAFHAQVIHSSHSSTGKATHEIAAWRSIALKPNRTGLNGPDDFALSQGFEDDGENGGGRAVLRAMEKEGVLDVVVILSRWYGGQLLGPVRFTHIETCTREVCQSFKAMEEVEAIIDELTTLDADLVRLRAELAELTPTISSSTSTAQDTQQKESTAGKSDLTRSVEYRKTLLSPPDVMKAKRLLTARQNAIKSVNGVLARARGEQTGVGDKEG